MRMRTLDAVMLAAVQGGVMAVRGQGGLTTEPAGGQGAAGGLDKIVHDLGSEEFAVREAAQKRLDGLGFKGEAEVKKVAAGVTDVEVKARLDGWVEKMEDLRSTHPPGITVEVKDAPLIDVAAALSRELGVDIGVVEVNRGRMGPVGEARYTLKMTDAPYWEVIRAITEQHAISFSSSMQGLRINDAGGSSNAVRRMIISGPAAVMISSLTKTLQVDPQAEAGKEVQPPRMEMRLTVMADPRMPVRSVELAWEKVEDDLGNVLVDPGTNRSVMSAGMTMMARMNNWTSYVTLKVPEKMGKKIAVMKGELLLMVDLHEERREITEPEKHLNETVEVGKNRVTIKQFGEVGNGIMHMEVQSVDSRGQQGGPAGGQMLPDASVRVPVDVRIVDATGKIIYSYRVTGGLSASFSSSAIQAAAKPLKVVLASPTRSQEVRLPVEIRDVILP
jgi:hypothetical protein